MPTDVLVQFSIGISEGFVQYCKIIGLLDIGTKSHFLTILLPYGIEFADH